MATAAAVAAVVTVGRSAPEVASARAACAPRGPASACTDALARGALGHPLPGSGDVTYVESSWVAVGFSVGDRLSGVQWSGNQIELAAAKRPFAVARLAREAYWVGPDGRGRVAHTDPGPAVLPSAADEAAWRAAGEPDLDALLPPNGPGMRPLEQDVEDVNDVLLGANGLYDFLPHDGDPLAPLPRTADALEAWLRERAWKDRARRDDGCEVDGAGCGEQTLRVIDSTVASDIATLLAYPATPPELRAALVAVLGAQPGVRTLGLLRGDGGRDVAAIEPSGALDAVGRGVVAFDPDTGVLRAVGGRLDGVIRWQRTYATTAARVPAVGARP